MAKDSPATGFSRNHRFAVGDAVVWTDPNTWPPEQLEGTVSGFDNEELTYLVVEFEDAQRILTEDDVRRKL